MLFVLNSDCYCKSVVGMVLTCSVPSNTSEIIPPEQVKVTFMTPLSEKLPSVASSAGVAAWVLYTSNSTLYPSSVTLIKRRGSVLR